MSSFEFILLSLVVILGFGISEVLAGFGRHIRHRRSVRIYPLQIAASAYVLLLSIRYLWSFWGMRDVEWTFWAYAGMLAAAMTLALAGHLVRVEVDDLRRTPRDQYFDVAGPFFLLLALFPIIHFVNLALHFGSVDPDTGSLPILVPAWVLLIGVCAVLGRSRSERIHAGGWAVLFVTMILVTQRVAPRLEP